MSVVPASTAGSTACYLPYFTVPESPLQPHVPVDPCTFTVAPMPILQPTTPFIPPQPLVMVPCGPPAMYIGYSMPVAHPPYSMHVPLPERPLWHPSNQHGQEPHIGSVTDEKFQELIGNMLTTARTSPGSSLLQACLRENNEDRFRAIYSELQPHFDELLLHSQGCYVVRALMERNRELLDEILQALAHDEQLVISLCTHSLHTRRIVQFLLEAEKERMCKITADTMIHRCRAIATTQQGCISMQRVLELASPAEKTMLTDEIYENFVVFSRDPYANYVMQYIIENGDTAERATSAKLWSYLKGNITHLACDKYASNIVEKALHHTSPEVQHLIVSELYSHTEESLQALLQDSFGSYIVHATVALCTWKDVIMISEKLSPILHKTPWGCRITARLERRLKGQPLTNVRTMEKRQHREPPVLQSPSAGSGRGATNGGGEVAY